MDYFAKPGISASRLKALAKSPIYYKWYIENGLKPSPVMEFGSMLHKYILEPEGFYNEYAIYTEPVKTKADKRFKELVAMYPHKTVIKQEEFFKLEEMYLALNDDARELLDEAGLVEQEYYWGDYKAKMDKVIPSKKIVIDYKSARSVDPRFFVSDAIKLGYHIQAAHYLDAFEDEYEFVFIAQEKEPPYINVVYRCSPEFIAYGVKERERLLKLLKLCEETDKWFGYSSEDTIMLELPEWLVPASHSALDDEVGYE